MRRVLFLAGLYLVCATDAPAHHAFAADYEAGKNGTIHGIVTEVVFKNPHARYYLEVEGQGGERELWDLETMNLIMLGRMGWKKDTIQVGDELTVTGILGRDGARRMSITTVTLPDGRVISPLRSVAKTNAELNQRGDKSDAALKSIVAAVSPGRYELDTTHAYLTFSYSHLGLSNPRLHFTVFDAALDVDGADMPATDVRVTVDAASIDSGVPALDESLRGADYFDTATHPQIRFASSSYQPTSPSTGVLYGELTVRGLSKPQRLDVTINQAAMNRMRRKEMIGVTATGTVKRSDFGLTQYAQFVSDELEIEIQAEFVRAD